MKLQYFGHLMRRADSWCWERLRAGGETDNRGWDGWMASPTQWTWVWVDSGSWWWTGRPGVLRFMGSQRVGHDWATELNWTELMFTSKLNWKFLYTPWPHTSIASPSTPAFSIVYIFTFSEPTLALHYPLKSVVNIRVQSWGCPCVFAVYLGHNCPKVEYSEVVREQQCCYWKNLKFKYPV